MAYDRLELSRHHPREGGIAVEDDAGGAHDERALAHRLDEASIAMIRSLEREDPRAGRGRHHEGVDLAEPDRIEALLRLRQAAAECLDLDVRMIARLGASFHLGLGSNPVDGEHAEGRRDRQGAGASRHVQAKDEVWGVAGLLAVPLDVSQLQPRVDERRDTRLGCRPSVRRP